ncbi:g10884 [Coccomyxa elongata]
MASPARGMKRLRKGKGKLIRDPLLEDEDAAELRGDDDDDVHDRVPSRRKPARNVAGRHDAGEAGPSNIQEQGAPVQASADELAHLIRQRDFYKAEAENLDHPHVSREEAEQLVASVMRYMLFRQHQKPDQLVRRDELSKLIQSNYKDGAKRGGTLGTYVISQAQAKFPVIFGLEMKMVEVSGTRAAGKAKGDTAAVKSYVLRSLLPEAMRTAFVMPASPEPAPAFELLVMSIITLAGGSISEEELWRHLDNVGVEQKVPHPTLGQPEHLLDMMLKKKYLSEKKQPSNEGPLKSYALGDNALDEIPPNEIKEFVEGRLEVLEADGAD